MLYLSSNKPISLYIYTRSASVSSGLYYDGFLEYSLCLHAISWVTQTDQLCQ